MQEVPTPNKWNIKCVRARVDSVSLSECVTFYYYYKVSTYSTQQSVVQPLLSLFFFILIIIYCCMCDVRCAMCVQMAHTRYATMYSYDIDRFIV